MHPGAWLTWATSAAIVAVFTTNPFYLVPLFGVSWLVYASCRIDHPAARSFKVFLWFGLATVVTRTALVVLTPPPTKEAVAYAFLEGLRLAAILAVFGAFNSVSDPYAILRLAPRRFHEPALAAALALSLAPRTIESFMRVREAQRLRGLEIARWRNLPALVVPVLESGMEEAVTLAESMDARGHGRGRRSRYRPEAWKLVAQVLVASSLTAMVMFVALGRSGVGETNVSTYPIRWPEVSLLLVVLVVSFAAPAVLVPHRRAS